MIHDSCSDPYPASGAFERLERLPYAHLCYCTDRYDAVQLESQGCGMEGRYEGEIFGRTEKTQRKGG